MITSSILLLLQLGAPTGAAPDDAAAAPPPFVGSLASGLGELRSLALEDRTEEALVIARDLLAREGVGALSASERGEVEYASGVALWRAQREAEATLLFLAAAGADEAPAELRRDALYDAGVMQLALGERWFGLLPEEGGQPPAPPPLQLGPDGEPLPEEPAPDPLAEARQAYGASKLLLVERLRLDWRDADTRANLELVQRRLARLDAIEEERQEQEEPPPEDSEEEQEEQEQQPDSESGDPSENEEPGEQEPSEEQQQENEEGEQSDEQEQQQPSEPSPEQSEEQEQEQSDSEEQDSGETEAAAPEEAEPTEEQPGEGREAQLPQRIEVHDLLTDEELIDLLELLETHEEELQEVRRSLRLQRRPPVERDW